MTDAGHPTGGREMTVKQRPNLLLVFSDQESAHAHLTPPAGPSPLHTPHQDALAACGAVFRQAYCVAPQCTPARAALLCGRYPHSLGVETNIGAAHAQALAPDTPTLGSRLQAAGYRTGYFGKWHLTGPASGPADFGFAQVYSPGGQGGTDAGVAAAAAEWIGAQNERGPWAAVVSFVRPHDIYHAWRRPGPDRPGISAPDGDAGDLRDRAPAQRTYLEKDQGRPFVGAGPDDWRRYRNRYAEEIEQVDACLGTVLAALKADGLRERTLIAYTSDHGDLAGAHGLPFKGPCLYEPLVHVPLVLSWPGHFPQGAHDALVSHLDVLPTLLAAAGAATAQEDAGYDLGPVCRGSAVSGRTALHFEYLSKQQWVNPIRGLRRGRWKLCHYLWWGYELYDVEGDPAERFNRAQDPAYAPILRRLVAELSAWRKATGDAGRFEDPSVGAGGAPGT